ncbi:MAG: DUF4142 domain-containing protein [Rhodospirillaceae bacterium]|nr:DUF4142 domain-containing protein [Rhodospirillaceae bacterium]
MNSCGCLPGAMRQCRQPIRPVRFRKRERKTTSPPSKINPGAAPSQSADARELNRRSGAGLNRKFLAIMVSDHEKAVDLFERASSDLKPGAAKTFAAKTLPTLKKHLAQAKNLQAQFGGDKK